MWRAVAAADRRAAWALAVESLEAQSGRTLSVVMTSGDVADRDVPRRRPGPGDIPEDDTDVCEDLADMS